MYLKSVRYVLVHKPSFKKNKVTIYPLWIIYNKPFLLTEKSINIQNILQGCFEKLHLKECYWSEFPTQVPSLVIRCIDYIAYKFCKGCRGFNLFFECIEWCSVFISSSKKFKIIGPILRMVSRPKMCCIFFWGLEIIFVKCI